jgi:hypothetical protein
MNELTIYYSFAIPHDQERVNYVIYLNYCVTLNSLKSI